VLALEPGAQRTTPRVVFSDGVLPSFALAVLERAGISSTIQATPRLIDYRGPSGQFPYLSFLSAYRNQFSYSAIQDRIVLLGVTLRGTDSDQILTPFGLMSGVEVIANEVYTLLYGRLRQLPDALYITLLMGLALILPVVTLLRRGLLYTLAASGLILVGSVVVFLGNLYVPPLWLTLLPIVAYTTASYTRLTTLDRRLAHQLMKLFDHTTFQPDTTTRQFTRGFAPKGYVTSAEDMLESLITGLGAQSGVLRLPDGQTSQGQPDDTLLTLTEQTLRSQQAQSAGGRPYYLSEPIVIDSETVGALGLMLLVPPPPHLQSLIQTSAQTFGKLARYQRLRERTLTYAGTLWPWRAQSSLGKLEALAMLEDLLTTERGWLGALLESLPQAAFIMSPYGFGIYENAAARRLFQGEKNMLTALPRALSITSEQFQEAYVHMVEQGRALEFGLTERDTERPVLLSLKVVGDGNTVTGVAGMVSDLSRIEELDRQRRELISLVVHDLRSPLTSIQGFSELMLEDADTSRREYLQIIAQEAARMRRMTDIFLDVVTLEAEGFTPQFSACNLAEVLRFAVASVSSQAAQKRSVITLDAPPFLVL
jgi:PAS domain-containing protein